MTATDWRTHDTKEFRKAFQDAQLRLDEMEIREDGNGYCAPGVDHYTPDMVQADEKLTDRYDRLVLQPAHNEFERQCEQDEFDRNWPEPPDGARIEWEGSGGTVYAAYRQDIPEHAGGSWWLYGSDERHTWERIVAEHRIHPGPDVTVLVDQAEHTAAPLDSKGEDR